ncbi:MAG: QueT transporter family protein [Coriobacteriia bacterium]|nr:QueT transporter family protein [Coriobacteriia bacterium]
MQKLPLNNRNIARISLIAALYASLSILTMTLLQGLSWGPVQFRISEALCVLALFTPTAIPGLTIGCLLANLFSLAANGTGLAGLFDVCFGSLASMCGAIWMWHFHESYRERRVIALAGPVVANALIVPAYLPFILAALGFYTIPFTDIDISGAYINMYVFGVVCVGIGEALVVYGIGWPLTKLIESSGLAGWLDYNS